jgi:LacI family transcriptional regulator
VPADLSLVGVNDIPLAALIDPPLTSVRVPQREMGELAVGMLIARIEGTEIPVTRVRLDTTLIVRASTAAPLAARRIA